MSMPGWLMENPQPYDFGFIEEAGVYLWTKPTRRCARGELAVLRIIQSRRESSLTLTFAVSALDGLFHHDLSQAGMPTDQFNTFL